MTESLRSRYTGSRREILKAASALPLASLGTGRAAATQETLTDWPMKSKDLQNTAVTDAKPATGNFDIEWEVATADTAGIRDTYRHRPSPVLTNDRVYLGDSSGIVRCLQARTGEQVWQTDVSELGGSKVTASLAVADGTVYVPSSTRLIALDAETGSEIWIGDTPTDKDGEKFGSYQAAPSVHDGTVYANFRKGIYAWQNGGLRAFDTTSGDVELTEQISWGSVSPVAINDGVLYRHSFLDHGAYELPDLRRKYRFRGSNGIAPPMADSGTAYYPQHSKGKTWGHLHAKATDDGSDWYYTDEAFSWTTRHQCALLSDGPLTCAYSDGGDASRITHRTESGYLNWSRTEDALVQGLSVIDDFVVYVVNSVLVGRNIADGTYAFHYDIGREILGGVPIPTDNRYLVHTWDGELLSIAGSTTE